MFTADNGTNTSIISRWNGREIKGGKGGMKDMGTHVPFICSWQGTTPVGQQLDDLIDFTDFYPTLVHAAGQTMDEQDPIDGRSFFERLRGLSGNPRQWVLCHYQPYWNKQPGQFARTQDYKLYRDGRFYHVPIDLEEQHNLAPGGGGKLGEAARQHLTLLLESCPPPPTAVGDRNTQDRPVYPQWDNLLSSGATDATAGEK
jgi:arylsulfatase A